MAHTDRAFRALARASPRTVVALLRLPRPALLRGAGDDEIVALDDPNLDLPPHPKEADFVATVGDHALAHVEAQGYRDGDFLERKFNYHLILALRHPRRTVRTVALWMRPPARHQRVSTIERSGVTIRVETVVLREVPASVLLGEPLTACFAAGADAGAMDDDLLCDAVVHALGRPGAYPQERAMAAVAAMTMGRYPNLVRAMERANMEPVIIEELVDYGYDLGVAEGLEQGLELGREEGREQGREQGREEGREAGVRTALLTVLRARGFAINEALAARVQGSKDVGELEEWLRRAAVATSLDEVFAS